MPSISQLSVNDKGRVVTLYCYAMYMQPMNSNKLFVTDFTSNSKTTSMYTKSSDFCGKDLTSEDMLMQLECYSEKWHPLIASYRQFHKQDLCDESLKNEYHNYDLKSKLCFLRVSALCKVYAGTLEAKLMDSHLLIQDKSREARSLYRRFFDHASTEFIVSNNVALKEIMPEEFWPDIRAALEESQRAVEVPESHLETQIKTDVTEEAILLMGERDGPEFPSSPVSEGGGANIFLPSQLQFGRGASVSEQDQVDSFASEAILQPETIPSAAQAASSKDYLTISQLNKKREVDNVTYKTRAFIVGTIPEDFSLVCVKSYEVDPENFKYRLGDPFLRELEIIICDEPPVSLQYNGDTQLGIPDDTLELNEENSMKITLQGEDILRFFDYRPDDFVETFYTKVNQYNHSFKEYIKENPRTFIDINLIKKLAKSDSMDLAIWGNDNLSINSLLEE